MRKIISFFFVPVFILLFYLVKAQVPPVATGVGMTGVMKRNHTLTVFYTYNGTNPQSGTTIQWIRYDDNCGTNPVNIGTGTTYTLVAADEGKHIGVRVTPRDNSGNVGTPVTYQPWTCEGPNPAKDRGPNPVLIFNANCSKADGVGVPVPGNLILNPGGLCSPRSLDWQVEYRGINYRLPDLPPRIIIDWADGLVETLTPTLVDPTETNMSKQLWRVVRNHTYNYAGGSTPSSTPNERCTYTMRTTWGVGTASCISTGFQAQKFTVWDREDNTNLGTHDINHDPTSTGFEVGENVNVCQGDTNPVRLRDATDFNCTPPLENPQPNDQARWVQFVYGTTSTITGNVTINGVSYTPAQLPVYGRVIYQAASTLDPVHITDNIQMPASAVAGQQFVVTMRTWNTCNPFDRNVFDGGLNPNQTPPNDVFNFRGSSSFQPQADFPNVNNYFANTAPVTRTYTITIISRPSPPTVANVDICSGQSRTMSVSPVVGGLTYRWYGTLVDALAGTNVLATGSSFTPSNAQAPVGERRHFWVTATAANGCVSVPTEVTLTRRPDLTQPPAITGPTNLCPSSNYVYTLPIPPAPVTIIDAITGNFQLNTEFFWTVPGTVGAITLGQGTNSLTITTAAGVGSGNISVVQRYVSPPATTVNGDQCPGPVRTISVNVRARPTVNITPNPANVCQGSTITLNGNPSTSFGTISSHTWGGATGILDNPSIQTPTVQASTAPGTYSLTYVATADFGGGVFCSSASGSSTVNVSVNPAPASTGPNQTLCFTSGPLISNPLGGSNPAPGTGTWSLVSGPGSVTFNPNANTPNATATVTANGLYTFRWTVTNGPCISSATVTVNYGTDPGPQNVGSDFTVCGLTATLPGAGATTPPGFASLAWSLVSGPGSAVFTAPTSFNTNVTVSAYGTYTFRLTASSGGCPTIRSDDINVTFNNPATVSAMSNFTTCLNSAAIGTPISLTGTIGGGATQGRWERVSGNGTIQSSGTPTGNALAGPNINDAYIPTMTDFNLGTITVRLVALDPDGPGPCTAVSQNVVITKDLLPSPANAGADIFTCDATANLGATSADNGGIGTWSTSSSIVIANVNNHASPISNIPVGTSTLTWTVTSALGVCSPSNDQVLVTRHAAPVNNNQNPEFCEDSPGLGTATVTLAFLTSLNDAITGIPGSVGRTVQFFTDAARTVPYPVSASLANNTTIYTRVTRTDVSPSCTTNGTVTIRVNARPVAINQNPEFCEDLPVGSGTRTGINLTTFNNAVKNNVAANTVSWFFDAGTTTPVPDPTNVTANNLTSFFARVT
ncbi:MAG: hypothetical protein RMK43_11730, partial [Cyclobacteriaceae bacterium]|nr:hypothetical protein [Cyclobacteriaceae bacterium]